MKVWCSSQLWQGRQRQNLPSGWCTPRGVGSLGLPAPQLQQEVCGDDGQVAGELGSDVPAGVSSRRLMHFLCLRSALCPCSHVSSYRWYLSSRLSISGPSCPPAAQPNAWKEPGLDRELQPPFPG